MTIKAYQKTQRISPQPHSNFSEIVEVFKGLTTLGNKAAFCIEEKQYEERSKISEKMIIALIGLRGGLKKSSTEDNPVVSQLEKYFDFMIDLIVKMNVRNDPEICEFIVKSFKEMTQTWTVVYQAEPSGTARL